jgi:alpha-tubulin suppressor-like RCC1 family protein
LSVSSSGVVKAWGLQTDGKLGNGLTALANVTSPGALLYPPFYPVKDAYSISAGYAHSLFLKNDGSVWAFGKNNFGSLGLPNGISGTTAAQVRKSADVNDTLTGCVAVAAGGYFSAALSANEEVYMWGLGYNGALGNGITSPSSNYAGRVQNSDQSGYPFITGINRIAVSRSDTFTGFALAKEFSATERSGGLGRVWAWGTNNLGQLGQGNPTNLSRAKPVMLDGTTPLTDAWDISCGASHSAVVRWKTGDPALQGSVMCSSGTTTYMAGVLKADSSPLMGITSVSASRGYTLALDLNGNVWAWGSNNLGTLGDNTTVSRNFASKVLNPQGTGDLQDIVRVSAGGGVDNSQSHCLAVSRDGSVYAWGTNKTSQLGITRENLGFEPFSCTTRGGTRSECLAKYFSRQRKHHRYPDIYQCRHCGGRVLLSG